MVRQKLDPNPCLLEDYLHPQQLQLQIDQRVAYVIIGQAKPSSLARKKKTCLLTKAKAPDVVKDQECRSLMCSREGS